jgi:hypothetical protein
MTHRLFLAFLLICTICALPSLGYVPGADDSPKKDKDAPKKDAKAEDKDAKADAIKVSQVRSTTKGVGKISAVDDKSFSLELGQGKAKQTLEILLAEDTKVNVPKEQEFDEKGKPKPFKPGYQKGSKNDLREGQVIQFKYGRLANKKLAATEIWIIPEKK